MIKSITKNILVIDNSSTSLVLIHGLLFENGYITKTASSLERARNIMEKWNPALILLDILPDTNNSIEFIQQIPRNENITGASIIIISSLDNKSLAAMTKSCGATDYLPKPVEPKILIRKVNAILTLHQI